LDLVPFGNVNVTTHGAANSTPTFTCQHGPNECYGNKVQACIIAHQSVATSLSYVQCMFLGTHLQTTPDSWKDVKTNSESCANLLFIDWADVKRCVDGAEGEKLIEANWKRTA